MKTEQEILAILNREIRASSGYIGGEIVTRRKRSLEYYLGKPFGNEQEGRSQVISTDVSDTIESILPSLMRIFTASDNVFNCEPVGPEDEDAAKQATDYLNYVFYKQNNGFLALYTMFKDALIQKNGIVKIFWDESRKKVREEYKKLTEDEFNLLVNDTDVIVKEHSEYEEEIKDEEGNVLDTIKYHDLVLYKISSYGKVTIEPVPPEEFLIERRAKSIDDANFIAHRTNMTRSQLIEMGYDPEIVNKLPIGDTNYYSEDHHIRYQDTDYSAPQDKGDSSTDEVLVHECYARIDIDGDGQAELIKACIAGDSIYKILSIEEIDSMPFISVTPILMPHRFYGRSVSELVEDIQLIKSTIMRQMLDNMYLTNNNRVAIQDGQVSMDDLLTNRPGGIVRTKQPPQNVIFPLTAQPITDQANALLTYLDFVKENRTGQTRQAQGLMPDTINTKTATGINQILTQSQLRLELIARIFAETGVKDLAKKIFELVCKYQQKEQIVRIRGKFIPMKPYEWRDRMNINIAVGLGTGSKEQQLALLNSILQRQLEAFNLQGNFFGPVVNVKNIYHTLRKIVENAGLGNVEPYFMDPEVGQSQMPPIPPKGPTEFEKVTLAQVQGENERAVLNSQIEMKKMETKLRESLLDFELRVKELELKYNTQIDELAIRNRSVIEQQQVKQSGDIFKKIMDGQKEFFNKKVETNGTEQPVQPDTTRE